VSTQENETDPQLLDAEALARRVRAVRRTTLALVSDLSDEQLDLPYAATVNPMRWELGHVGFFYDCFLLSELDGGPTRFEGGADLFDSFEVDHADRWGLALPSREKILDYLEQIEQEVLDRIAGKEPSDREQYVYQLAVHHESMHDEAFAWTRQAMEYAAPVVGSSGSEPRTAADGLDGDVHIEGGSFELGADPAQGFVFDNEKWGHEVVVPSFEMSRAPVTNRQYREFVEAGGYSNRAFWSTPGWSWRGKAGARHPLYWKLEDGVWLERSFESWAPLRADAPVVHVGWYEAQAYCNWAGRRLPNEAEWEYAASTAPGESGKRRYPWGDAPMQVGAEVASLGYEAIGCSDVAAFPAGDSGWGCRQMLGNVWEWTDTAFYPYPGFVVDTPYREYSAPWFGYPKVLKGGAWSTHPDMVNNTYRNFFEPNRRDIFAGFRTCAVDASEA